MSSLIVVLLVGCVPLIIGPKVHVMPKPGINMDIFRADDQACTDFAWDKVGGRDAVNRANQAAVGPTVLGALLGAGLGAAAGAGFGNAGAGAGVGAATGVTSGALIGDRNAHISRSEIQEQLDIAYTQCMYLKGHQLPQAAR